MINQMKAGERNVRMEVTGGELDNTERLLIEGVTVLIAAVLTSPKNTYLQVFATNAVYAIAKQCVSFNK